MDDCNFMRLAAMARLATECTLSPSPEVISSHGIGAVARAFLWTEVADDPDAPAVGGSLRSPSKLDPLSCCAFWEDFRFFNAPG